MRRTALLLKRDDTVCGVDDDRAAFDSVELIEDGGKNPERISVDKNRPEKLGEALKSKGVTDIIADHYQPKSLNQLRERGFTLWISPPQADRLEAEKAWREGSLLQAALPGDIPRSSARPEMPRSSESPYSSSTSEQRAGERSGQSFPSRTEKGPQSTAGRIGAEEE